MAEDDKRPDWPLLRQSMLNEQIRSRGFRDARLLDAMGTIPREVFVPEEMRPHAYEDRALPIGQGQTISQPFIVAYMTDKLALEATCRVLEIGTGTGYQTSVLAMLCRHVFSVERVGLLQQQATRNLDRLNLTNVSMFAGDGSVGLESKAPFDRILVTAAAPRVPKSLVDQLVDGGILVAPVGEESSQRIVRVERRGSRTIEKPSLACRFVKLIGHEGWQE